MRNKDVTPLVFVCTDVAIDVYSAFIEHIQRNKSSALEKMTGAHFESFFFETNKSACQNLVKGCVRVRTKGVFNEMPTLPLLTKDVTRFFKPLLRVDQRESVNARPTMLPSSILCQIQ